MRQKRQVDPTGFSSQPELGKELNHVLQALQARIAQERSPGRYIALVRLVEGLSLADWQKIATEFDKRNWLALPLDVADGLPLQAMQQTLEELAYQRDHDMLTGLGNRRLFDRSLVLEMQRSIRTKSDLSLVMLDIDNFKLVNDTYGHLVGDKVLIRLGETLRRSVRAYDVAARIGGEEFCLILPGASIWRAQVLARRILETFRKEVFEVAEGVNFSVTFSAGAATASCHLEPVDCQELLSQADRALYLAKRQGKNRVATLKPSRVITENPALVQPAEKHFLFTGDD